MTSEEQKKVNEMRSKLERQYDREAQREGMAVGKLRGFQMHVPKRKRGRSKNEVRPPRRNAA